MSRHHTACAGNRLMQPQCRADIHFAGKAEHTTLPHRLSACVRQAETHPAGQVGHIDAQQCLELLCVQEEPAWRLQAVVCGGGPGLSAQGMLEAARQADSATCRLCLLRVQVNDQVSTCKQRHGIQCRVFFEHRCTAAAHSRKQGRESTAGQAPGWR